MIVTHQQSIEDLTIETLAKNPYIQGPDLVSLIQKPRPKTTKQAVYSALRSLMKSEAVAKVGNKYFLSQVWVQKVYKLFQEQKASLLERDAIFDLKDRESISYHFPSLLACDTYWAHVVDLLVEYTPETRPIFVWNPHEWVVIGRKEVEKNIFKAFQLKNKYAYFITRGTAPLDKEFKRTWSNSHVAITTDNAISFEDTYYLNIFDDFIIEVFIGEKLAKEIDEFFKSNEKIDPENTEIFKKIISRKNSVRMKISRKTEKASLLRKKLSKDFFIAKHLVL